jgi:hypothetical protein
MPCTCHSDNVSAGDGVSKYHLTVFADLSFDMANHFSVLMKIDNNRIADNA